MLHAQTLGIDGHGHRYVTSFEVSDPVEWLAWSMRLSQVVHRQALESQKVKWIHHPWPQQTGFIDVQYPNLGSLMFDWYWFIRGFSEIGIPYVNHPFIDGFSMKSTIQLWGYPFLLWKPPFGPTKTVETAALERLWLVHIVTDVVIDKDWPRYTIIYTREKGIHKGVPWNTPIKC